MDRVRISLRPETLGCQFVAGRAKAFLKEWPLLLESMQQARLRGDAEGLANSARSLKEAVSYFASPKAVEVALLVERLSQEEKLDDVYATYLRLVQAIEQLEPDLARLAKTVPIRDWRGPRVLRRVPNHGPFAGARHRLPPKPPLKSISGKPPSAGRGPLRKLVTNPERAS